MTQDSPPPDGKNGIQFGTAVVYDDAYSGSKNDYVTSLPTQDEESQLHNDDDDDDIVRKREASEELDTGHLGTASHPSTLAATASSSREDVSHSYRQKRFDREVTKDGESFKDVMHHATLDREKDELLRESSKLDEERQEKKKRRRKRRWDDGDATPAPVTVDTKEKPFPAPANVISDAESETSRKSRWDDDATATKRKKRWDETP
eukprot:CAMPEP_0172508048 /NCGR_PEP_ID=MMETSP1066-20121228/208833_1 /TAXON_ID=671091 /ORGANISM="Coscinodiscus wailesii, Strain CCMP2513" /LENGTH=205 /DNA_ID=CAMNT_0013285855 /DNA_START=58 /DNA_END=671 /DNA_ORIENTATION=+